MYKIMIADDEQIERNAFRLMIEKNFDNLELIPDATTGNEVIAKVRQYKPDILFLDIQMPEKSGLDALIEFSDIIGNMKVIILSAYDKFEYAQKAMKYGACEYLLKPVHRKDMVELINYYIKQLDGQRQTNAEHENIYKRIDKISPHIENEIISHIIQNTKQFSELKVYFEALNVEAEDYVVIFLKNIKKEVWPCDLIAEVAKEITHCAVSKYFDLGTVILLPINKKTEKFDTMNWVMNYAQYVLQKLREKDISTSIGISHLYSAVNNIHECYRQAFLATANNNVGEINQYNEKSNSEIQFPENKKLIDTVLSGEQANIGNEFYEYFRSLLISCKMNNSQVKQKIIELFIELGERLKYDMLSYENNVIIKKIESTDNVMLITDFIEKHLIRLNQKSNQNMDDLNITLIKAIDFIKQNYVKEIMLVDVAEHVKVSPFYLSKLFKTNLKKNFVDFITEIRIQNAQRLLISTDMSIKEITYEIGYNNPTYFCQVFKKLTGKSAGQYRKEYYLF